MYYVTGSGVGSRIGLIVGKVSPARASLQIICTIFLNYLNLLTTFWELSGRLETV